MQVLNLTEESALVDEHLRPKIISEGNGQELKVVKVRGVLPWHIHEVDELFIAWRGQIRLEAREAALSCGRATSSQIPPASSIGPLQPAKPRSCWSRLRASATRAHVVDPCFTAPDQVRI